MQSRFVFPATNGSGMVFALRQVPGRGPIAAAGATVRFLRSYWWQLLAGGAIAAGIALLLVRWLARGMTKPLRDMANATRRMARGDYSQRVETTSRDEVGALAAAFNIRPARDPLLVLGTRRVSHHDGLSGQDESR